MSISKDELNVVRELANRYAEIAADERNAERRKRMQSTNDLVSGLRPSVLIDEIPWHEMDIDGQLTLRCSDSYAQGMERFFRRKLFAWKYFQCDMIAENFYAVGKSYHSTGYGMKVSEHTISSDKSNNIISHEYVDQLATEEDLQKLHLPVITPDKALDEQNLALASEILGDILPVKLRGNSIYFAPWDEISTLRGVEPILLDMVDRPEFLHKTIAKFAQIGMSTIMQLEENELLDYDIERLHCTPPYTSALPAKDYDGGRVRLKDIWMRSMAQMFSTISPAMHEEFDLDYLKPLFEKCGLVYYGCCEPLDNKIELLKKIPNLRKIGVSPWSNIQSSAEQMGGSYVFARKPNPAAVAIDTDPETVKKEISQTIELCMKYGCPYEFVLKDISTVSYKPQNLILWEKTVRETIDRYY